MAVGWVQLVAGGLFTLLSGAAGLKFVEAIFGRRRAKVDAVDRFADSNLKWVEQFQEDASAARTEASAARREANEALVAAGAARQQAEIVLIQMQRLAAAVHDPTMTIEHLRLIVPYPAS
jgi:outer membrane murein-binding lipoprotein Lpp